MGRNGRTDLPRGSIEKLPPLSRTVFSLGRPLTGHNWVAPLFLIDQTPLQRLLILALLLIRGNVHPNLDPISNHPHPRYPCSICHLDVRKDSFQCSACLKLVHFLCSSLIRADFRTICATGTAQGWRCPACHPQSKTGSPSQTRHLVTTPASPPPLPQGSPHYRLAFIITSTSEPPRYLCSMCSLKVGKDSLKCSTCSKWVHFSCSSLTRADFRKICTAGSPTGWNCPACLNGDLASPTHQQASLQLRPHPHPPQTCSDLVDSSSPPPHTLLFLTPTLFYPTSLTTNTHKLTTNPQLAAPPSNKSTPLSQSQNSAMECRRSFLLPSC